MHQCVPLCVSTGQWISPARVRRAVENTCMPLGGASPDAVLTYGRGMLQVNNQCWVDTPAVVVAACTASHIEGLHTVRCG